METSLSVYTEAQKQNLPQLSCCLTQCLPPLSLGCLCTYAHTHIVSSKAAPKPKGKNLRFLIIIWVIFQWSYTTNIRQTTRFLNLIRIQFTSHYRAWHLHDVPADAQFVVTASSPQQLKHITMFDSKLLLTSACGNVGFRTDEHFITLCDWRGQAMALSKAPFY